MAGMSAWMTCVESQLQRCVPTCGTEWWWFWALWRCQRPPRTSPRTPPTRPKTITTLYHKLEQTSGAETQHMSSKHSFQPSCRFSWCALYSTRCATLCRCFVGLRRGGPRFSKIWGARGSDRTPTSVIGVGVVLSEIPSLFAVDYDW